MKVAAMLMLVLGLILFLEQKPVDVSGDDIDSVFAVSHAVGPAISGIGASSTTSQILVLGPSSTSTSASANTVITTTSTGTAWPVQGPTWTQY